MMKRHSVMLGRIKSIKLANKQNDEAVTTWVYKCILKLILNVLYI